MSETLATDPLAPFAVAPETDVELAADLRTFYDEIGAAKSRSTAAQWRRALAQFATSAGTRKLADLPVTFVADAWFTANCPPDMNPVQKATQLSAIKQFAEWTRAKGLATPAFTYPVIPRAPRRPTEEPPVEHHLIEAGVFTDGPPAVVTPLPEATTMSETTTPVVPIRAAGKGTAMRSPLKAMLPSGFKLRIWRQAPDGVSQIYVNDFPSELVRRHGGVEAFLKNYVLKREPVAGQAEVVYLVAEANPSGELTSEVAELPVSNSAALDLEPAEVPPVPPSAPPAPPAPPAPTVIVQPTAPAPAIPPPPNTAGMTPEQMMAALDAYRASIDRLAQQFELRQPRPVETRTTMSELPPPPSREVEELRHEVQMTQQHLAGLAAKLDAVLERVVAPPPAAPPVGQKSGMAEAIEALPKIREAFAPEVVDTSTLEREIAALAATVKAFVEGGANKQDRRGGLREMAEDLKFVRETLGGGGGFFGGEPSRGAVDLLAGVVDKLISNSDRLAEAWDRIVQSTARAKMGMVTPTQPALPPSGSGSTAQPPPPQTKAQQIGLPADVQSAIEGLLAAEGDEPIYSAILTLLGALNAHTETQPIVVKVQEIAATGADGTFQTFLHSVFTQLGYGEKATPLKLQTIIEGFYRVHTELESRKQKRAEAQAAQRREERKAEQTAAPTPGDDAPEDDAEVVAAEDDGDDGGEGPEDAPPPAGAPTAEAANAD